ncbi:hypothetical protein CTI12_AA520500 [Artemisia annua]|uniref:Aldehyde dehydrogenase domain-containing protein n=1 Tax=Artemisia annua TaxID=35608 RepID=A0A2U1L7X3_ARTAN|nr:hypothetical protein CTI12_AA520500 [Artemisia annua]
MQDVNDNFVWKTTIRFDLLDEDKMQLHETCLDKIKDIVDSAAATIEHFVDTFGTFYEEQFGELHLQVWYDLSFISNQIKNIRDPYFITIEELEMHDIAAAEVSSRDTGKTMVDASMGEIMTTREKIHWLISEGERWLKPEYRSCGRSMLHKTARVEFHPLGVVGAIVSWNHPFHNLFNPVLAAVFSGNGIVVKDLMNFEKEGDQWNNESTSHNA